MTDVLLTVANVVHVPGDGIDVGEFLGNRCIVCEGNGWLERGMPRSPLVVYDVKCVSCDGSGKRIDQYNLMRVRYDQRGTNRLPTAVEAKWHAAMLEPGKPVDLSDVVACDICMTSFRGKSTSGGFIASSTAVGPCCAVGYVKALRRFSDVSHTLVVGAPGQSFWEFVLGYRRVYGQNWIMVEAEGEA